MMKRSYKNKTKQKSNESMEIEIKRQERQKKCVLKPDTIQILNVFQLF